MSVNLLRRTALLTLLLPFLYLGTASATFLYRIHADNSARTHLVLPESRPVTGLQRILIFSPHPDDETLGCAGLIQQARTAGAPVNIAILTNGDGFRVAVERQFRQLNLQPSDYVQFAGIRQQETYKALSRLGVDRGSVSFLGYPDRGLLSLWTDHWSAGSPYYSPYTRTDRSPYSMSLHAGSLYCGQSLLDDIKAVIRDTKPTDVYVTHPSDDHVDHTAASSFVTLALRELKAADSSIGGCKLHYYLVHRGDWPAPQGMYRGDMLVPPSEMAALDTTWVKRPLTDREIDNKSASILTYESQTAVMKRFLVSFARRNELFGTIETARATRVESGRVHLDGSVDEWKGISPVLVDPINDNLLRDFQSGGDVRSVYACRDNGTLYLRIDTRAPVSAHVEFRLGLRYFGDDSRKEAGGSFNVRIRSGMQASDPAVRAVANGNRLELAIPLREIGYSRHCALNVDSFYGGIQVDRTGYRFVDL